MAGNERLQQLTEIVNRKGYKFSNDFNSEAVLAARELRTLFERENGRLKPAVREFTDKYQEAFTDPDITELLGISIPSFEEGKVIDFTMTLELEKGMIFGLALPDLNEHHSFKYSMISGLFLMKLMMGGIGEKNTLVDCGLYNSAKATMHLAERFGLKAEYYVPNEMKSTCSSLSRRYFNMHYTDPEMSDRRTADNKNLCYLTMARRLKDDREFAEKAIYLGHSELGWAAMLPVASAYHKLAKQGMTTIDQFISCVGAGTTFVPFVLEGFAKNYALAEDLSESTMTDIHDLDATIVSDSDLPAGEVKGFSMEDYFRSVNNISRKLDDNPFIPDLFWGMVRDSYLVGCKAGYNMMGCVQKHGGMNIGVTTALCLAAAKAAVDNLEGGNPIVAVPIFEDRIVNYATR